MGRAMDQCVQTAELRLDRVQQRFHQFGVRTHQIHRVERRGARRIRADAVVNLFQAGAVAVQHDDIPASLRELR